MTVSQPKWKALLTTTDNAAGGQQGQGAAPDTRQRRQPDCRQETRRVVVRPSALGIRGTDRDGRDERQQAARTLRTGDQIVRPIETLVCTPIAGSTGM
jgi:hypothetical protein